MERPQKISRRCKHPSHQVDGELVIYDPEREVVHRLNETARLIWEFCDDSNMDRIAERIASTFDVSIKTARKDCESTVGKLRDMGLITLVDPD